MSNYLEQFRKVLSARNTRWLLLILIVIVLALAIWLSLPGEHEPAPPWRPVTQRFDPERCTEGKCKEWVRMPPLGDNVVLLIVDPEVDDEIAQWSDCLATVASCMEEAGDFGRKTLVGCVRRSRCPERCREDFMRKARSLNDDDQVWALYNAQFVDDGGMCVP